MTSGALDVRLAPLLMRLFPDAQPRLTAQAATVGQLIDELDARWPGMGDCIRDSSPAVRRHVSIFVDGHRARLDTRLAAGTDVYILTAISGG
ncbi:MAG: molybdopterin synthase sulfur carrier subunit [Hyphomicrobiales bacterium]|nr:molybdopterin synthase sulfur carrier subunit [Hyphomicrobiales bacterium]